MKDKFYTISDITAEGNAVIAMLVLNEKHPVFEGHFPGQPIVPGVCMMQIVKEIAEVTFEQKLRLVKANDLKFLNVIDPRENKILELQLNYTRNNAAINVLATLSKDSAICFKFNGVFSGSF